MPSNKRCLTFIMDGNFNELEGEVYSPHMHYAAFLGRFTPYFDKVSVFARAFQRQGDVGDLVALDNSEFCKIGSYRGALGFLKSLPKLVRSLCHAVNGSDIILLRFPGNIASLALLVCEVFRKKYSVEIVAEPRDYFSKHSSVMKLRWFAKVFHSGFTTFAAKRAVTVRYVTRGYLQANYPASSKAKTFGFSDVYLPGITSAKLVPRNDVVRVISVAMMHNHSKGHLVLLKSLLMLKESGVDFCCDLIGDGVLRKELECVAAEYGLSSSVNFMGQVAPSNKVWEFLSRADIFVLPSFQEGMPRSLLEAMQLGLACVATDVGGVSEVLPECMMVRAGDHHQLYEKLKCLIVNRQELLESARLCSMAVEGFFADALGEQNREYVLSLLSEHD